MSEHPEMEVVRKGEYSRQGDFHRNLSPDWSYYPIYINKTNLIDRLLRKYRCQEGRILDAGCGEGVLVEKYKHQGWDITGVDVNYASAYVMEGSITELPFPNEHFQTVLCLDVLEHLPYADQEKALAEIRRVLVPGGLVIFSVPNLAHFTARLKFLLRGRLLRTASISHHPGDRPYVEYQRLFETYRFQPQEQHGIFPTVPPIYRYVMRHPSKSVGLLRFLMKLPIPLRWHFQIISVYRKAPKT